MPPSRPQTEITHGLRAGLALLQKRPGDVTRVAFSKASARLVEPVVRPLKSRGISCRILPDGELDRIASVPQHEGLIVEAKARTWVAPGDIDVVETAIALDRVRNPYNAGAIVRSAAFFGVKALIIGTPPDHPGLDPQAVRVAEGGVEHLVLARTTHLADALALLKKKGATVVGADGHAKMDVADLDVAGPRILVFGNEREGLHDRIRKQCDRLVAIRGSGNVESLNVAVAAGILIRAIVG